MTKTRSGKKVSANASESDHDMPGKNSRSKDINGISKNSRKSVDGGSNENSVSDRPVRVYADGVFDMYHEGHARVLEQAKKLFPNVHLIVGVSGDEETIAKKGRIVMSQKERCAILKHCKWVDEVLCPCPWIITLDFLNENKIDYVAHDDLPYGSVGEEDIYAEIKAAGKFMPTQRTEGISTSDIILRIIQDYNMYVDRSLSRGYNRKEIGISWTKFQRMKWRNKIQGYIKKYDNEAKTMQRKAKKFTDDIRKSQTYRGFWGKLYKLAGVRDPYNDDDEESDFDA